MARIPENFIQDLLARVDIVEVVDARVALKKSGRNYMACCPFHNEKTPSFSVAPDKQFYYCFGCGASGNAVGFLMEYEQLGFREAVEQLASRAGMEVPREQESPEERRQRGRLEQLMELLDRAGRYYRRQLKSAQERGQAVDYLKGRGLSGEIAARFGLGFAPPGFNNLINDLSLDEAGVELALEAGLLVRREDTGRTYDKFRNRIIYPIRDSRGRTLGFGGRVLDDGKPKYLNSPETPVFHKGRELYGLYEWHKSRERSGHLFVVEGYMDVIALAQHGVPQCVATLGTATTEEHVRKIFRQVDEVVFCFDGDDAGRRAAWRALESTLAELDDGKQARFLFLAEGQDPDDLVRNEGPEALHAAAAEAPTLSEFLFRHLEEDLDTSHLDGRARLARRALPWISRARGEMYRSLLRRELAERTRLTVEELERLEEKARAERTRERPPEAVAPPAPEEEPPPPDEAGMPASPRTRPPQRRGRLKFSLPERLLLSLVRHPELVRSAPLPEGIEELELPRLDLLLEVADLVRRSPDMTTPALLGRLMAQEQGDLVASLLADAEHHEEDPQVLEANWRGGLAQLEAWRLEQLFEREQRRDEPDPKRLQELNEQLARARMRQESQDVPPLQ